jgi:3-methyladenine DNA glycosylase Tag
MEVLMAKVVQAFADNSGQIHSSAEYAIIADLSNILGRVGAEAGITQGLAQLILKKRPEIERAFADFDAISTHQEGPQ